MRTFAVLVVLSAATVVGAEVVYGNLTTPINHFWNFGGGSYSNSFAEEVHLGGSGRTITRMEFSGSPAFGQMALSIKFLNNDGAAGSPGSVIWHGPGIFLAGHGISSLAVPNVLVPDHFTVAFQNMRLTPVGDPDRFNAYGPPTVGTSADWVWRGSDLGSWTMDSAGPGLNDIGLALHAVPEPGALAVLGLGLALARRRLRR